MTELDHDGRRRRANRSRAGGVTQQRANSATRPDGSIVFAERVLVWVDRTVSRLMSETRHRALMRRARRADDRLEQAVNRSRGKDREC